MSYHSESSYYESAEGCTISKERAKFEVVNKHNCDWHEFLVDMGEHDSYCAQSVLAWIGY